MKKLYLLTVLLVMITMTGCGKRYVPVGGQVLYDGKPAKDIVVLFEANSDDAVVNESAMGKTNANGEFSLKSVVSNKNGIIPGEYIGFFGWENPESSKKIDIASPPAEKDSVKAKPAPYVFPTGITERKYKFNVTSKGMNNLVIKITKDDVVW